MGALLDDLTVDQDQDRVCVADRAETVSDDKARARGHELVQRRLDLPFGPGVDAACRLIKNEQIGTGQRRGVRWR